MRRTENNMRVGTINWNPKPKHFQNIKKVDFQFVETKSE